MESFYTKLADILEVDTVEPNAVLRDFEVWDSLTVLTILALLDKDYGINMVASDLAKVDTVAELASIVQNRAAK